MNVYEEAHSLARAVKESNEFIEFDRLRKEMEKDDQLNSMLKDFQRKQLELQAKQMSGEPVDQDMMQQIQGMYTMLASKPQAADYLQAEASFSVMMKDVYDILADVINIKL